MGRPHPFPVCVDASARHRGGLRNVGANILMGGTLSVWDRAPDTNRVKFMTEQMV